MAGIDEVRHRMGSDPEFRDQLGTEPLTALEAYDLSAEDLRLLEREVSDDLATPGAVESAPQGLSALFSSEAGDDGESSGLGDTTALTVPGDTSLGGPDTTPPGDTQGLAELLDPYLDDTGGPGNIIEPMAEDRPEIALGEDPAQGLDALGPALGLVPGGSGDIPDEQKQQIGELLDGELDGDDAGGPGNIIEPPPQVHTALSPTGAVEVEAVEAVEAVAGQDAAAVASFDIDADDLLLATDTAPEVWNPEPADAPGDASLADDVVDITDTGYADPADLDAAQLDVPMDF